MSGLCGIIRWDGAPMDPAWINAMMSAASWRGPDGSGCEVNGSVGIGYLSHQVTPESVGERQPLVHGPTGIVVSADARLDNREELPTGDGTAAGRTVSDAEVLLDCYLQWGDACAQQLLGDFAYAVWDPRERTVSLARDAMGMRPLYYRSEPHRVIWASELKQLLAVPGVERRLNETAVAVHLSGSFLPLGMTYYDGIAQVVPGEVVTVDEHGARARRYWSIDCPDRLRYRRDQEYAEHFRELFERAVECRLRSVKPAGISLSGGIDSGSVASMVGWMYERGASRYTPEFRAYSWAFEELTGGDERAVSRIITDRYQIPAVDVTVDTAWPLRDYPERGPDVDEPHVFYYDEAIHDVLATAAGHGVGLLMTGERGDFLVGHWVYDYPGLLARLELGTLVHELAAHGAAMGQTPIAAARELLLKPLTSRLRRRNAPAPAARLSALPRYLTPRCAGMPELATACAATMPSSDIQTEARRLRYWLIFSSMTVRRIELIERDQARHGIDHADPWSDRRLAEFVSAVPQHLVHRFQEHKRIVRNALEPVVPQRVREHWNSNTKPDATALFERGVLERSRGVIEGLIRNSVAAELGYVTRSDIWDDYQASLSRQPLSYDIWWFITMEMWLQTHWK